MFVTRAGCCHVRLPYDLRREMGNENHGLKGWHLTEDSIRFPDIGAVVNHAERVDPLVRMCVVGEKMPCCRILPEAIHTGIVDVLGYDKKATCSTRLWLSWSRMRCVRSTPAKYPPPVVGASSKVRVISWATDKLAVSKKEAGNAANDCHS